MQANDFFNQHPLMAATLKPKTRELYIRTYLNFKASAAFQLIGRSSLDKALNVYVEEQYQENPAPGRNQEMSNLLAFLR